MKFFLLISLAVFARGSALVDTLEELLQERLFDETELSQEIVCSCATPRGGTSGHNKFSCTNGHSRYCAANEECYNTRTFKYGHWASGCRVPTVMCTCDTPNAGTSGHNKFFCNNGITRYCAANEVCYKTNGSFRFGHWSDGCRVLTAEEKLASVLNSVLLDRD